MEDVEEPGETTRADSSKNALYEPVADDGADAKVLGVEKPARIADEGDGQRDGHRDTHRECLD